MRFFFMLMWKDSLHFWIGILNDLLKVMQNSFDML